MKKLLEFKAIATIWLSILLISIASAVSAQKIAIIDAGSSGSRLWVYEIDSNFTIKIDTAFTKKGPALSSVNPDSTSVKAFLDSITNKYEDNNKDTIPLYILATAGMRMIPMRADSIYKVMNRPNGEKLAFNHFRLDTAMTISGKYEGFYAWLAANYKAGKLEKRVASKGFQIKKDSTSLGTLEIGGASMQVAFALKKGVVNNNIIVRDGLDTIYSKSYLHYGVDRIYDRLGSLLTPNCLVPLDAIENLYENIKFIGLSKPIGAVLKAATIYSKVNLDFSKTNEDRKKDNKDNFHPATNAIYIDWVVYQLNLRYKLQKQTQTSDWTEGAALDIIVNGVKPEAFNDAYPN